MGKDLNHAEVYSLAENIAHTIRTQVSSQKRLLIYPVPRGGVPIAYILRDMVGNHGRSASIVDNLAEAMEAKLRGIAELVIVDDLIDSGATRDRFQGEIGKGAIFQALIDKPAMGLESWVTFPWERKDGGNDEGIEENVRRLLQWIEPKSNKRPGLIETPARVAKAYAHWFGGYVQEPAKLLKVFDDGAECADQMVVVKDIRFYSHCEHHMAPFFGEATVAYIPDGRIVGLSKIARVVDCFSRRLQVQERLTNQIADAINDELKPKGVGVIIKARHLCMESRGVDKQGSHTRTSALRGHMLDDAVVRDEFLRLA